MDVPLVASKKFGDTFVAFSENVNFNRDTFIKMVWSKNLFQKDLAAMCNFNLDFQIARAQEHNHNSLVLHNDLHYDLQYDLHHDLHDLDFVSFEAEQNLFAL